MNKNNPRCDVNMLPKKKKTSQYSFWGAQCAFTHFVQIFLDEAFFSSPRECI